MARRGRKTSLTPDKHHEIVTAIKAGVPKIVAIRAARIDPSTYYKWLAKGERLSNRDTKELTDYEKLLVNFFHDIESAEAIFERYLVTKLIKAVEDGDVNTAKWMLERRRAKNWVLRTHIGVSGSATEDAPVEEVVFTLNTPTAPQPANSFGDDSES